MRRLFELVSRKQKRFMRLAQSSRRADERGTRLGATAALKLNPFVRAFTNPVSGGKNTVVGRISSLGGDAVEACSASAGLLLDDRTTLVSAGSC